MSICLVAVDLRSFGQRRDMSVLSSITKLTPVRFHPARNCYELAGRLLRGDIRRDRGFVLSSHC
jgi:hypothetical protein